MCCIANMSSLDNYRADIVALRSELASLSRRRARLTAQLNHIKTGKTVFSSLSLHDGYRDTQSDSQLDQISKIGDELLAHMAAKHDAQTHVEIEHLYRLSGVTGFRVQSAVQDNFGDLFGVRIECFVLQKFVSPHYIIFSRNRKSGAYEVYKHTVPLHVPLQKLAKLYLGADLKRFIRHVRRHILLHLYKETHFAVMSHVTHIETDPACELVKLELEYSKAGVIHAYLRCDAQYLRSNENLDLFRDSLIETLMLGPIESLESRL
ncbi:hypothetical protein V1514DRAFT_288460, partial [Lipomyces japonicus]|uniref:uncharacterized protein n=1 Tax=Lipomyces japonicus TaxID=56871 RepID=UPI0034CF4E0C